MAILDGVTLNRWQRAILVLAGLVLGVFAFGVMLGASSMRSEPLVGFAIAVGFLVAGLSGGGQAAPRTATTRIRFGSMAGIGALVLVIALLAAWGVSAQKRYRMLEREHAALAKTYAALQTASSEMHDREVKLERELLVALRRDSLGSDGARIGELEKDLEIEKALDKVIEEMNKGRGKQ